MISLSGPHSILGRAAVHADPDDLGRGGHELSNSAGNAGARIGCGQCQAFLRYCKLYHWNSVFSLSSNSLVPQEKRTNGFVMVYANGARDMEMTCIVLDLLGESFDGSHRGPVGGYYEHSIRQICCVTPSLCSEGPGANGNDSLY